MDRFEVHTHDHYSNIRLLDSINRPERLVNYAIEQGLKGLATTNHECLSGAVVYNKLQQEVIKEHPDFKIALGNEIYLTDVRDMGIIYYHFILIAKDEIGFKILRELSSIAWMQSYYDRKMERVPTLKTELVSIINKYGKGHLIATSACLGGELSSCIVKMEKARKMGDEQTATEMYQQIVRFIEFCVDMFGSDFYIECAPAASSDQIIANTKLKDIAAVYNIPMVIGTDAHYLKAEDRYVHESYLNSKDGDREVASFYEYAYLQTEEEIITNLHQEREGVFSTEQIEKMFANSIDIYNKIEVFDLFHPQEIPKVAVKDYPKEEITIENCPVLSSMYNSDDIYERYWVNECEEALKQKDKWFDKQYWERLEYEADIKRTVGEKLGTNMFRYPITLQHYIDMFWECKSLVGAGRGSSCSGLNHYLLGVTQLDPIKWDLPFWRYLNKERIELGDIDLDICPSKRPLILNKIKEERGKDFVFHIDDLSRKNLGCTLIATFGTETTKSAILAACRGYRSEEFPDGIDSDTSQFLSNLVPSERGFVWGLKEVYYGNPDKGRAPVTMFVKEMEKYPGLFDIMSGIEGLINKRSSHASGVILFDEDPYKYGCFMKTPKGEIITQYNLHDCEYAGMTKYDFLVTEVEDKLAEAMKFLQKYGQIEEDLSLREIYDKYFFPDKLPLNNPDVWKAVQEGRVINIFQFDSEVGSQAAKKIKPQSIMELSDANGLMRLMTAEKGQETPMDKYIRFKNNISLWYNEMDRYGLTKDEQKVLEPHFLKSYGVPPSQEQLMTMLMDENICGFSLKEANAARKIVGKKQMSKIPELHQSVLDKAKSPALGRYVWECGIGPQMGYSFSIIHALAYSFIGFQTAYIGTKWNPIYWDTACLIVNSGSLEEEEDIEYDEDGTPGEKKEKAPDYAKMATAIGDIINHGIKISLVDINKSSFGFEPNEQENTIMFGLKPLSHIGASDIEQIIGGRPYASLKDFMMRCKIDKQGMVNLIKGGAFDELEAERAKELGVHPRVAAMTYYLSVVSNPKSKLNLQNFNGLINEGLIPEELEFEKRVFVFNQYLKKSQKVNQYYVFNDICLEFYNQFFDVDLLEVVNGYTCIPCDTWKKIYDNQMNIARDYIKEHQEELLSEYNFILFKQLWDKYALGNLSSWEMDALCFYYHDHELKDVDHHKYGLSDFTKMPTTPVVDRTFKRNGREIPLFKIDRIAGTVIAKNNTRSSISLLTTTGVVTVKFTKEFYAMFSRQLSELGDDGKKHVVEKGWFNKGTKLMVSGFRRDDTFVAKKYSSTPGHQLYKIDKVEGKDLVLTHERKQV